MPNTLRQLHPVPTLHLRPVPIRWLPLWGARFKCRIANLTVRHTGIISSGQMAVTESQVAREIASPEPGSSGRSRKRPARRLPEQNCQVSQSGVLHANSPTEKKMTEMGNLSPAILELAPPLEGAESLHAAAGDRISAGQQTGTAVLSRKPAATSPLFLPRAPWA